MPMYPAEQLTVKHLAEDFSIEKLDDASWTKALPVRVATYWSCEAAPAGRAFEARLLWTDTALYVRFDAAQDEPLVVSEEPDLTKKSVGLWDRDVCEIFIAPDRTGRNKYFEFEIAPTGEWIDLGIEVTPEGRKTDFEYFSGMTSAAKIEKGSVVMAVKIPFKALGETPMAGDVWLGNLFRCVGGGPARGYLAWQPTRTETPNFHVPEAFGEFRFAK
jgi:alpha-galactosidase